MDTGTYGRDRSAENLSLALGWFSIALGAAELVAPRQVARLIGVTPRSSTTNLLRAHGARELVNGAAILAQPHEARWLWSRVSGDAVDLAALGGMSAGRGADSRRVSMASAAILGVAVLDILCARRLSASEADGFGWDAGDEQAMTIHAPLERAEEAWISWCSSGYARLNSNYAVRFEPAPGARGTEVRLSGDASKSAIREELRRFKQYVETGEVVISDGPGLWRAAQPAADAKQPQTLAGVE